MTALRYVLSGALRRRVETASAVLAIALTVAFLASLGSFVSQTGSRLTQRAAEQVPVDWQVQLTPAADAAAVRAAVAAVRGLAGVRAVDYAEVPGLSSTSGGRVRTTGAAYLVSLPGDYAAFAPGELRPLLGSTNGPRLQQQTAANLSAGPGSVVQVLGGQRSVTVAGVVDLPAADSFFQVVGAPAGSGANAPPDNVLILPPAAFRTLAPSGAVVHQLHVRLDHTRLPHDPAKAADDVTQRANNLASTVAGGALVGDDLGATLSAAREDAVYSRLLVLLLGLPGLVLSGVVTGLVVGLRNDRLRRDLGLLRLRGATARQSGTLVGLAALLDGLLGAALGLGGALSATRLALGADARLATPWLLAAAGLGVVLALGVELAPVLRSSRRGAPVVADQVNAPVDARLPLPLRLGLDVVLLAASGAVFALTARGGYQVVVVPEGVPVASVDHAALLAPSLAWPGAALLVWRLTTLACARHARRPATDPHGRMRDLRHDVVRSRRRLVARGATGLAVAVGVTVSAAVFTTTYDQQARVDVALTVGSDVAVTLPPDSPAGLLPRTATVPGVRAVEQVAHRLAYVGPDLQDLYGVDAGTVGRAAPLQDAFTPGSSVATVLDRLARTPDGALLSQETLHDYQLHEGDLVRLRLKDARGVYGVVPFHVVGVVTEFATAPRDSFVVANRSYVARATGVSAVQTLLVRTDRPRQVAARIHAPAAALVNDITAPRTAVPSASGLAAGSLSGLSTLILGFGVLLAALSAGLVLTAGAAQRRRSLVALGVLGASPRQRHGFVWSEAQRIVLAGLLGGTATGALLAYQLVKVLTGIFDPAPQHPAVPWAFLVELLAAVLAAAVVATSLSARWSGRVDASRLRDL